MKTSQIGRIQTPGNPNRTYRFPDLELNPNEIVTLKLLLDATTPSAGHSTIPERQRQIDLITKIMEKAVDRR